MTTSIPGAAPLRATPMPPEAPVTRPSLSSRVSPVWIIPLIAAVLGLWLVARQYTSKGPEVTVRLETAAGIIAGKTPVLCRSVPIGTITRIELADDLKGVNISMELNRNATRLLVEDTQIWVVRARYSAAGISGLDTLVTGTYVELQPGVSEKSRRQFVGLENPPATPPGIPGLRFALTAAQAGGLGAGASIIYKGITVGKLETRTFHPESGEVEFMAFIQDEYTRLVEEGTRFYKAGGLDLKVGADGVQLSAGTLESLLTSSVTFTDPRSKQLRPNPIKDGRRFALYSSLAEATKPEFNPTLTYLLLFSGSVRGLSPDAPVEFRGIRVGSVDGASFKYLPGDSERRVPVLIKIDPALLLAQPDNDYKAAQAEIADNVQKGLRASLKTGSLLTGQLYVDLDFQKDPPADSVKHVGGYDLLPTTTSAGLEDLQQKVGALLDKFQALPIEKTVENANETLSSAKGAVANLNRLTEPSGPLDQTLKNAQKITAELSGSKDISATLHNVRQASEKLNGTVSGLGTQFSQVGANLSQASDTVKRQPWRLIWPTTKKYGDEKPAQPRHKTPVAGPRPTPGPQRR